MKAVNDRVYVQVGLMPEKQGLLYLPKTAQDAGQAKINVGRVISCGPGLLLRTGEFLPMACKPGDVITWEQYGTQYYEMFGKNRAMIRSEDVTGIVEVSDKLDVSFDDKEEARREEEHDKLIEQEREKLKQAQVGMDARTCLECGYEGQLEESVKEVWAQCPQCGKPSFKVNVINIVTHVEGGTPQFHK